MESMKLVLKCVCVCVESQADKLKSGEGFDWFVRAVFVLNLDEAGGEEDQQYMGSSQWRQESREKDGILHEWGVWEGYEMMNLR